jgi:predicted nucleic acid-binding protein
VVIFVDTSALLAIVNPDDEFHFDAKHQWFSLIENQEMLLSNNYVILESISLIQRRQGMQKVSILQAEILPLIQYVWVDEEQHRSALETFIAANRRNLSLVDCASFESMRRLGIKTVFTFDEHFKEQGFQVIP